MTQTFIAISMVSFAILTFASLLSKFLVYRNPSADGPKKVWTIIRTWWLIVAFLLAALGAAPWGLLLCFFLISIFAAKEYFQHSSLVHIRRFMFILISLYIFLLYLILGLGHFRLFLIFPLLGVLASLPLLIIFKDENQDLPLLFSSLVGPILIFYFLACLPAIYLKSLIIWGEIESAQVAIFLVVFLTETNDVSQFICGKIWGKRKILPKISPNKTEAGFIGGLLFTGTIGTLLFTAGLHFSWLESATISIAIAVYGIIGDLLFSSIKRYFGTKDFSEALPGHGGLLDRLDSIILAAPVVLYLILFMKDGL